MVLTFSYEKFTIAREETLLMLKAWLRLNLILVALWGAFLAIVGFIFFGLRLSITVSDKMYEWLPLDLSVLGQPKWRAWGYLSFCCASMIAYFVVVKKYAVSRPIGLLRLVSGCALFHASWLIFLFVSVNLVVRAFQTVGINIYTPSRAVMSMPLFLLVGNWVACLALNKYIQIAK